jgi:hypothetical protein
MHPRPHGPQLLDHEPPAGRRLQRRLALRALPAAKPAAETEPLGRPDPPPPHLARSGTERVKRDLLSMLAKGHHDPHKGPPQPPSIDDIHADPPRPS